MPPLKDTGALMAEDFEPYVAGAFELQAGEGVLPLTLKEVVRLGQAHREGEAFSLMFVADSGPWLPQAIYPVAHPAIGRMEIFLVPVGPVKGGNGYQAIFT